MMAIWDGRRKAVGVGRRNNQVVQVQQRDQGQRQGAPPSSPAKLHIVVPHPDKEIATAMTEEDEGSMSLMMVAANNNHGTGGCCPSRHCWWLEVVLPSPTLPTSCNSGGSRGAEACCALHKCRAKIIL